MNGSSQEWLAAFPASEAKATLHELEAKRAELDHQINGLRALLDMVGPTENGSQAQLPLNGHSKVPAGMDAVERILAENPKRVWKRAELHKELARRGWFAEGEAGRRTLGSVLHRMVRRGRVARVGTAMYQ